MSNKIAELRKAIESNLEQEKIKIIIETLSPNEINEFLRSKENGKTVLELVFTTISKETAFILLARSHQKYCNDDNAFSWLKMLDLLEDFLLSQKNRHKKIRAKRFASKLSFLSRYKEEIDVASLVERPKFFAAALLLGAKLKSNNEGSLFDCVFNSKLRRKPKKDLIAWLLDNKFINNKSISVEFFSREIIQKGSLDIAEHFIKHFPSMLEDNDDMGRNVMHFCVLNSKTVRVKMFKRCLDFVSSHASEDQIYRILTARSYHEGVVPAISIVREGLRVDFFIPSQVLDALARLAKEGKQDTLEQLYHGSRNFYNDFVLKAYLIQCGMHMDVLHFTSREVPDLSQMLWFVEDQKKQKIKEKNNVVDSSINTCNKNKTMEISVLPTEILSLIMLNVEPFDLKRFSVASKTMMEFIKKISNEAFWKEYYERHFKIGSGNWQGSSYKDKFVQETKGLVNWRKKKYNTITLPGKTPLLMDENWLLSRSAYQNFSYWNCHTHEEYFQEPPLGTYAKPLALLNTYSQGKVPPVIYTRLQYSSHPAPLFAIRSNGEDAIPQNAKKVLKDYGGYVDFVKPIDHRVLINRDALLYDVEVDQFLFRKNEQNFVSRFAGVTVNPFNRTFTKISLTNQLEVYNYQYELLSKLPNYSNYDFSILEAVDEYTLFFQEYSSSCPNGFIDLRTGNILWSEHKLLPSRHAHEEYCVSSTRIVARSRNSELLASFHLPSQKFEWIHQSEFKAQRYHDALSPVAVNKRYLASNFQHGLKTVIFDFCSDL